MSQSIFFLIRSVSILMISFRLFFMFFFRSKNSRSIANLIINFFSSSISTSTCLTDATFFSKSHEINPTEIRKFHRLTCIFFLLLYLNNRFLTYLCAPFRFVLTHSIRKSTSFYHLTCIYLSIVGFLLVLLGFYVRLNFR